MHTLAAILPNTDLFIAETLVTSEHKPKTKTMSLSFILNLASPSPTPQNPRLRLTPPLLNPQRLPISSHPKFRNLRATKVKPRSVPDGFDHHQVNGPKSRWENMLSTAASMYPLYVTVGGVVACVNPSAFAWFVKRGPASYSLSLGFIMLAMGLTLQLKDFFGLFMQRPLSILFGCVAQYTIMPTFGVIVTKSMGLSPSLSVGLILLACCPGGTASNVVTLIAQGDIPLSIVMTVCTTLGSVLLTPLLTKILAGAYIPVDALKLSISTLQVVVAPILLGSYMQCKFPAAVKTVTPFAPLVAVLLSSLLASSVFSENVIRFKSTMLAMTMPAGSSVILQVQSLLAGELGAVTLSVILLHFAGFFVGYFAAALGGFGETQRRAVSIEVGMQNSSLGVILATSHFTSPLVALPPAVSAVVMNTMGSTLGLIWKHVTPISSMST